MRGESPGWGGGLFQPWGVLLAPLEILMDREDCEANTVSCFVDTGSHQNCSVPFHAMKLKQQTDDPNCTLSTHSATLLRRSTFQFLFLSLLFQLVKGGTEAQKKC